MPPVCRVGDICTGHGCYPPRACVQGSPTVLVNGIPLHRQSDAWASHCCVVCHSSVLAAGCTTVLCEGLQVGRVGDPVACGSAVATGSPNVLCGDG